MTTTPQHSGIPSSVVRPKVRAILEREPHRLAKFASQTGWTEDLTRAWVRNARPVDLCDIADWADALDVPMAWLVGLIDAPLSVTLRLGAMDTQNQ